MMEINSYELYLKNSLDNTDLATGPEIQEFRAHVFDIFNLSY